MKQILGQDKDGLLSTSEAEIVVRLFLPMAAQQTDCFVSQLVAKMAQGGEISSVDIRAYSDVSRSDDLIRAFREISPRGRKESASRALGLSIILPQLQPTTFLDYQNLLKSPCCGVKKSRSSRADLTFLSPGNAVILKLSALSFWNRVDERPLHISLISHIRQRANLGPLGAVHILPKISPVTHKKSIIFITYLTSTATNQFDTICLCRPEPHIL